MPILSTLESSFRAGTALAMGALLLTGPGLAAQSGGSDAEAGTRYAVVIGISEYADPSIPDLEFAAEDARAFHEFLASDAALGFEAGNVRLLVDDEATAREVRSALTTFLRQQAIGPEDAVFVFVVAHGMPDPFRPGEIYLLTHDTQSDDLPSTGIPLVDVRDALLEFETEMTVFLADVSRSAAIFGNARSRLEPNRANGEVLRGVEAAEGYVAFTASESGQISREGEEWGGGHGIFTHHLLEGLYGEADQNRDGIVVLGEMLEYTRDRVRRATRNAQIPTISLTSYDRFWPVASVNDRSP